MIPDIEFVLGMVGSTIGSAVGIIFPSLMYIKVQQKNTMDKSLAQLIFVVGVAMMVVGTYSNLQEANRSMESIMEEKNMHIKQVEKSLGVKTPAAPDVGNAMENAVGGGDKNAIATSPVAVAAIPGPDLKKPAVAEDTERREPVVPHPPKDEDDVDVGLGEKQQERTTIAAQREEKVTNKERTLNNSENVNRKEIVKKLEEGLEKKVKKVVQKEKELEVRERKADELLQELQNQKDEQKQLIEEQKEVLQQMKEHVKDEQAQASNNEGKTAVVSQENKLDFERLPSDNVIPARAKVPDNDKLPKPSPRGPLLSPDQYKNPDPAGQFARVEDSQVQQAHHLQPEQPHNQTNMAIQRAEQDRQPVYQQHNNQRPVVGPGGIQQEPKQDLPRGEQGQQQQPQNEHGFHQGQKPVNEFGGEERLYRIPNRGNQIIPENEAVQRKSNDPKKVGGKSRADTIDDEVGVGRDLKSMVGEGRT